MGPPRGGDLTVDDALEWNTIVCPPGVGSGDMTEEGRDEGSGDGAPNRVRPVESAGESVVIEERGAKAADLRGIVGNLLTELLDGGLEGSEESRGGEGVLEYGGGWDNDVDGLLGCSV